MVYRAPDASGKRLSIHKKTIVVPKEWMEYYYEPDAIGFIMNLDVDETQFVSAPAIPKPESGNEDAELQKCRITDSPIVRVKYNKEHTKTVTDLEKLRIMMIQEEERELRNKRPRKKKPERPKKTVFVPASWTAKAANGMTKSFTEAEIIELFGERYVNAVKTSNSGFVDVPVGDYKISQLHHYPELYHRDAPGLRFTQSEGQDLCVSKAFASTLFHLGFKESAFAVDQFGLDSLAGGAVDALDLVMAVGKKTLPKWIITKKMPTGFHWMDLQRDQILLAVLVGSDGSNSHSVCMHGRWIFDANETIAIPLSQKGLNYCTSNPERACRFRRFWKGWLFYYEGNQKSKVEQMRGPG
jgi:hypothetical protein